MFRKTARSTSSLRSCPVCRSQAISEATSVDAGEDEVKLLLHCGACGTWRSRAFHWTLAMAVERRLTRLVERDRDEIEADLRRMRVAGVASDDFRSPHPTPPLFY